MFVTVCLYGCECVCVHVQMLIYICLWFSTSARACVCVFACACVSIECAFFVLTRACAPSTVVAWGSQGRALSALFLTQGTCYKLLTLPTYLLISLLSISLSAPRTHPYATSTHKHLKGDINLCFLPPSHVWGRETGGESEARWWKPLHVAPVLLLSLAHHSADSEHLT